MNLRARAGGDRRPGSPRRARVWRVVAILGSLAIASFAWRIGSAAGDYPPGLRPAPRLAPPAPASPPRWAGPTVPGPTVVVLLFDGLSPVMVADQDTPAFDRMRREGAWTHHLAPAFPTVSLVNGFTLTTGCRPARHGIVHNRFLDPERGLYDHDRGADWIVRCEPLHLVAERQGVRTAALDWYAAHSQDRGWLVTEAAGTDPRGPLDDDARIDWTLSLLARPRAERPRLILTYLSGPDSTAHFEGLGSEALRREVAAVDAAVARVIDAVAPAGPPSWSSPTTGCAR